MKNRLYLLVILLISFSFTLIAQVPELFKDGIIKGTITDATDGTPLPFANITLHSQKDSSYIGGTATGTTGEFILTKVVEGNYYLKVSFMGYNNKLLPDINISQNDKEYNVGEIKLTNNAIQLQETEIVGDVITPKKCHRYDSIEMSVKISFRVSKKEGSEDGRNTDNESKRIGSIEDNQSDRNKSTDSGRRGGFDWNQLQADLPCVKENKGARQ